MDEALDAAGTRRLLIQRLESLEAAGVRQLRRAPRLAAASSAAKPRALAEPVQIEPVQIEPVQIEPVQIETAADARPAPRSFAGAPHDATVSARDAIETAKPGPITRHSPPARLLDSPPTEGLLLLADAPSGPPLDLAGRVSALEVLRGEVAACQRCPHLAAERTQTVFGVGNVQARLCLFGEAPGADEDRQGEPFVGKAGQLLNKILEACTLRREDVYILNVLKCRPPQNRTPEQDEVTNCREYFERQLDILRPEFICCLGSTAARALLKTEQTIGRLRGSFHEYRGATVICTYHPSYLLRNPAAKRDVWEDMKMLMRRMGVELDRK
jgi:uracil-DNA glycosylase family 4